MTNNLGENMKDFNWGYVMAGIIFGYFMYQMNDKLIISIILGLCVALGGNRKCIFQRNKKT